MRHPVISRENPLVLASSSPRRKRLLRQVGLPFRSRPGRVPEGFDPAEDAPFAACSLAEKKARSRSGKTGGRWTLGADTMVVLGGRILGKPGCEEEAREMLRLLSGREHEVITGFCILDPWLRRAHLEAISTRVRMRRLSEEDIRAYTATGEPFGKAGSYAIQGIGAFLVEAISGSYTNVVGLPVCALIQSLLAVGALHTFPIR
ncbi:MAG: septum formation protein Maf [Deltaproteobacteria bacterium]|nr:septum formation protein Maf [Deltaproteobacteria bacterium]